MKSIHHKQIKGVSLMEMVVVIVIISIVVPGLMEVFRNVSWRAMRSESTSQATFYAEQLMEEISSKGFDQNTVSPWSSALGTDSGETYPNYNDVDDFNGYSDTPAAGYIRSVAVVYLDPDISPAGTWQVLASGTSDYKRVSVSVSRADNLIDNITLVTIVSGGH